MVKILLFTEENLMIQAIKNITYIYDFIYYLYLQFYITKSKENINPLVLLFLH